MNRLTRRAARLTAGAAAVTLLTAGAAQAAGARPAFAHATGVGAGSANSSAHLLSLPADYDADADGYSMYNVTLGSGAQAYWKAGYTGQGVGVALIDSGVSPVDGLNSGNVVYGPDLSIESQASNLTNVDSFGHGTHMAGIIAGRDATATSPYVGDKTDFVGMAPGAHIVSVKVADAYGDTDVTQLIAAIDWVLAHKDDPGMNIRVINLSVGIDPSQSYLVDPLAYAVEQAWAHGIVVVVAAGNDGTGKTGKKDRGSGLQDPAYDPMVLAVGAADTNGTATTVKDDTVSVFSSTQGVGKDADRKPDLVAPGEHIASLRDPGSWIDQGFASTGAVDDRLMRGSGTSQAAAVVSGAAALIISQHPDATPDQVKNALMHATDHLDKADPGSQGNGEIDLTKAVNKKVDNWNQPRSRANGTGSLQADRPDGGLVDSSGSQLSGELDIFGNPVSTSALAQAEAAGTGWATLAFSAGTDDSSATSGSGAGAGGTDAGAAGVSSAGVSAGDTSTSPDATSGHTWSGHTWSSGDWAGHTWSSDDWSGHTWSGHTWSGHTWSGHTWSASSWADEFWSSVVWQ
ncbi:MAG TPA: S8 family serine peptidase [Acidimicrobiales bacterium]|nr:S8 family serine peptidase [Acidimicrobiales bacterium]